MNLPIRMDVVSINYDTAIRLLNEIAPNIAHQMENTKICDDTLVDLGFAKSAPISVDLSISIEEIKWKKYKCLLKEGLFMDYKNGKWAGEIIGLQKEDGSWGYFHSLAATAAKKQITTEQALRRLSRLGFTKDDEVIKKALNYLNDCLMRNNTIPDRMEKGIDWDIFTNLMLAVGIRNFTHENTIANDIAKKWRLVANSAFEKGKFDQTEYDKAWKDILKPKNRHIIKLEYYYPVLLLAGEIDTGIEKAYYDYIFGSEKGYYYGHEGSLTNLPEKFQSKQASRFLAAIELFSAHPNNYCKEKLQFVAKWLQKNKNDNGKWDMGAEVKDGIYFPLSNSWRTPEARENDCTYRIQNLLYAITKE